jgi:hypothetical protein
MLVRVLRMLKIPGMVTGLVTGLLVGALAAVAGASTGFVLVAALGLGIPLAFFGMAYDWLLDSGRFPFGRIAPTALYGVITFPLARLVQEFLLTLLFGEGITLQQEANVLSFLAYQAIMGFGYGIGFLMIHSQVIEFSAWREYRRQQAREAEQAGKPRTAGKQA